MSLSHANPKPEIRVPKEARRPKSEQPTGSHPGFQIRNSDFGFLSAFGIRVSDFKPSGCGNACGNTDPFHPWLKKIDATPWRFIVGA
jgi:hypothetical protein